MKIYFTKLHYNKSKAPLDWLIVPPLKLASLLYGIGAGFKNFLYDNAIKKPTKVDAYVISVGNLTTGGVGKTPIVNAISEFLINRKNKVCIVSRGYGGELSNKEVNIISDGKEIKYNALKAGDEPFWHAMNSKQACVITSANRINAAKTAIEDFHCNVIVLDDAFQHRRIYRDLNILLVDDEKQFGNKNLLPLGPLRESIKGIQRADKIVVVSKSFDDSKNQKLIEELSHNTTTPILTCKMVPDIIYNIKTGEILKHTDEAEKIVAFSAIAQPQQFYNFLREDYEMVEAKDFKDHHQYTMKDIVGILELARSNNIKSIITTEKDAVKVAHLLENIDMNINLFALKLKAEIDVESLLKNGK